MAEVDPLTLFPTSGGSGGSSGNGAAKDDDPLKLFPTGTQKKQTTDQPALPPVSEYGDLGNAWWNTQANPPPGQEGISIPVVGAHAPGYVQGDVLPLARREDVINDPNARWYQGWALAPGPFRAFGMQPSELTTIDPSTNQPGLSPEALTAGSLALRGPPRFSGPNGLQYVPPGTFDTKAPLSADFRANPLSSEARVSAEAPPGGPTSQTGVPKTPPTTPPSAPPPTVSVSAVPTTSADAKQIASQYYKINEAQGGQTMPPEFINALSDDLNARGPKGPLETAVAGDNRIGNIAAEVQKLRDQPTTLEDAQRTYSRIGDVATAEFKQNGNSETYRDLMQIQANMRDRISPPDLAGNDAWTNARKAWSQAMKMEDLERIQERANLTDNPATSIRTQLRTMLTNPNRMRGYSPEEVEAVQDAADRGVLGGLLHVFGSRLIPIVAGATHGLPGAAVAYGASTALRAGATALQNRRLTDAMTILGRNVPPAPNPLQPPSP